jgi:hypothetical protein
MLASGLKRDAFKRRNLASFGNAGVRGATRGPATEHNFAIAACAAAFTTQKASAVRGLRQPGAT